MNQKADVMEAKQKGAAANRVHPNFLVIGAEKAGTTWLYARLAEHPDVYVPDTKEIHYFNEYDSNLNPRDHFTRHGADWYARFFQERTNQSAIGEVTPMYLCDGQAPSRIASVYPDIKLVVVLRNPVDRFTSHFWMASMKGHHQGEIAAAAQGEDERFVKRGNYAEQLDGYYGLFPSEKIKVFIFEEMIANPEEALDELAQFLGVRSEGFREANHHEVENGAARLRAPLLNDIGISVARFLRSNALLFQLAKFLKRVGVYRFVRKLNRSQSDYPPLDPSLRTQLEAYYRPQVERIEARLGRKITAWAPAMGQAPLSGEGKEVAGAQGAGQREAPASNDPSHGVPSHNGPSHKGPLTQKVSM